MADHTDDTILDDELDENDYNFDNENEDDLLADNDDWIEKTKFDNAEKERNNTELQATEEDKIIEQLEAEEDVLDIGLVEDDVDPELQDSSVVYPQVKSEPVKQAVEESVEIKNDVTSNAPSKEEPAEDRKQENETTTKETVSSNDDPSTAPETNNYSSHEDDQEEEERTSKSKVISLRKAVKKTYDDLPELAKVIPGSGSSRNHKFQRSNDSHANRKEVPSKHDYDDKKKRDSNRRGRDRDRDRDYDRDRDRERDRYRDRSYDRDRDRDRDRDYGRSTDFRDDYSYSSDDDRSPSPFRGSMDHRSENSPHNYQGRMSSLMDMPADHFQKMPDQYPPPGVQMTQERYDFPMMRPGNPPNQMLPPNSMRPPLNQMFGRPPPPRMEHMMRPPPPGAPRMPPQPMGFPHDPSIQQQPPHQPGFRPPPPQMAHRFPSNLPPHVQVQNPPMHMQPPPFNGPSQPQLPPQQMMRQPHPPHQMQPPFRPPGGHLRPPQPMPRPMEQMRPGPHPNMRPPMLRLPMSNERQQTPMMGQPTRQMPPQNNFLPPNNGMRMSGPAFRPLGPPPQNVGPRAHGPPPVEYYNEQPQFHGGVPPATPFQPTMNRPPPPYSGAGNVPGQPMPPPVNNRVGGSDMYQNSQARSDVNYQQYPQQNFSQQSNRQYSDYPQPTSQYGTGDVPNPLRRRMNTSSNDSSSKFARYDDGSRRRDSEDKDLKVYREKVEDQKRLREKYVQEKEEQRLKNQMQNFIQNNIRGILEKREQVMRKTEIEHAKQSRETSRVIESKRSDEPRRLDTAEYRPRRSVSPPRRTLEIARPRDRVERDRDRERDRERIREVVPKERPKISSNRNDNADHRPPRSEKKDKYEDSVSDGERKHQLGLHKVVRIKYKDGSVALKSIPVNNNHVSVNKPHPSSSGKIDEDSNSSNSNRRRMVVSQKVTAASKVKNELNENLIVESVRKNVTQSSVTLAKRFSNLKAMNRNAEDDDSSFNAAKSNNRLVIPDEDGTRTALIRNLSVNTSPAVLQKMTASCGTVSRTNWIYGGGHSCNQVKITFGRSEDAKKFCHSFNRKTVDASTIAVSMISERK